MYINKHTYRPIDHHHSAFHRSVRVYIQINSSMMNSFVFPGNIPNDIVIQIGETEFLLHKMVLVAKSNYIRRLILESKEPDLKRIDLHNIPGGAEIFKEVAKFCYGVVVDITVNNVAALHCAAEYLEMTDGCCDDNLASKTYTFLTQVAFTGFSAAITVLNSCVYLLPIAQDLNIVNLCVEFTTTKVYEESIFPCCSPPYWWAEQLSTVDINFFRRIIDSMKSRGCKALMIASAITTYAKKSLPEISLTGVISPPISDTDDNDSVSRIKQREILASIVDLLPIETQKAFFSIEFICYLLRTAIFLKNEDDCKMKLEKWISSILEHLTVEDLLLLSYSGEKLGDLVSVRRILIGFVEKEKKLIGCGEFKQTPSMAMVRVTKTVDAFLREIARDVELSILKFNEVANLVPKDVRQVDDELYRAIDIYLEAHPDLDEIEREKVCNSMDPFKLSFQARVHASKNKKLPLQIVLHTLYHDQIQVRSGQSTPISAQSMRFQVNADMSLAKENEKLKSDLLSMKMYIADMEKKKVGTTSTKMKNMKKPSLFTSMSKTLGKLNPFKQGSKDTLSIDDGVSTNKPRRRRFSMS